MTSELGPRTVGEIISEGFRIYREHFFALELIVLPYLVVLSLTYYFLGTISHYLVVFPGFVLSFILYPWMEGAVIYAVSERYARRSVSAGDAHLFAWRRLGTLIGASLLRNIAAFAMAITIVGIPFAIYFANRWSFALQAALLEGYSARPSLSRSSDLVRNCWWRVFGILLLVAILVGIVGLVLALLLWWLPVVNGLIVSALLIHFPYIAATLLYFDLRVRKEKYNLAVLSQELLPPEDGTALVS